MKKALILPGWFQKTSDNWYPWLREQLNKKGYQTSIVDLPTMSTQKPKMQEQLDYLFDKFEIDEETAIVGHSLGALLTLRVAERKKFHTMILIVGWDFNDLEEGHASYWEEPIDHSKIIKNTKKRCCISSKCDKYISRNQSRKMSERLEADFKMVEGAGHFTSGDGVDEIKVVLDILS